MPPIPHQLLSLLHQRRSPEPLTNTDDASSSTLSTPPSTPIISLIITTIILSILVAGCLLYLSKLLWKRYILPKRERRRSKRLLSEKEKAWEGMAVYFGGIAGVGGSTDDEAGGQKSEIGEKARPEVSGTETASRREEIKTKAKKGRTHSDELWSTVLDHDTSYSFSSDDEEEDSLQTKRQPYRTYLSLNQNPSPHYEHQYGIARGSGRCLPSPSPRAYCPREGGRTTSLSSMSSTSSTSSSILFASVHSGSPFIAGTARAAKGEATTVTVKQRSRFLSLGGGGKHGCSPLGMHPVREDDLVDVPACETRTRNVGKRGRNDKAEGRENETVTGLGIGKQSQTGRESWPLRSLLAT